jgi:hypothetical protein
MRLRLANMTATWKTGFGQFAVLAGQDYGLVNPLFGTSITHTADPIFWQAGNPWRRAPQIRAAVTTSPELLGLNVAAAILSPQTGDGAVDFGSGNASRFPSLEGRAGINSKFGPATVAAGLGYLYGKRRIPISSAGTDVDGTILGVDVNVTSPFVDVKGEWFMQDGAGDTYNTIAAGSGTPAGGSPQGIESDGFWAQAILKPIPLISIIGGYGREEVDRGSLTGAGVTAATTRLESEQIHVGLIFNAGKSWKFGVEGVQTTTTYLDNQDFEGRQVALSSQFVF